MILVIGATGTTGQFILHRLSRDGIPCRALLRPKPGRPLPADTVTVSYVSGDALSPDDLARAMQGVDAVMVALGNGPRQEEAELGIISAAQMAGVARIVKLSGPVVGPDAPVAISRMHGRIEDAIRASGLSHTFLQPYGFMQNLLGLSDPIRFGGCFFGCAGAAPMNFVDARDIADVGVAALTEPGHHGQAYVLTGPEALSYGQLAERMTRLFGRRVIYVNKSEAALREDLAAAGRPPWLVDHIAEIQAMAGLLPEVPNSTVRDVTGHGPRTLDAFLQEHAGVFAPPAPVRAQPAE